MQQPTQFWSFIAAIVIGITFHEFMHAYVAHRLGDDTARLAGRLSLNPMAHLDLLGSLFLLLFRFGYGKPVPVNESRLQGGRAGGSLVALAGPFTNLALAGICAIPLRFGAVADLPVGFYRDLLFALVVYNCLLFIFNLLPVPPLDGARVVYGVLPPRQAYTWRSYEQYGPIILLALVFFIPSLLRVNVLGAIVQAPAALIARTLLGPGF
ncbi:MAG: site-2 protease family protein [Chloroflexi bacterium]|nr:site-2 protease family protein [Chloroflexota bacterium]